MKIIFAISLLFLNSYCFTLSAEDDKTVVTDKVFSRVETRPEFPGGDEELSNFLMKTMRFPIGTEGFNTTAKFVIRKDGSITDLTLKPMVKPEVEERIKATFSKMPKWTPGKMNGHAVNCEEEFPIFLNPPKSTLPKKGNVVKPLKTTKPKAKLTK